MGGGNELNRTMAETLKHYFGFDKFKGDQGEIIQHLLDGNDSFVLMPTGGGKSLCYQLPSLLMEGTAIVVSPLIALMKNQVDVINGLSEEDGVAHYMNSSLNRPAIVQVMADVEAGKTKLLYVAPESLAKEETIKFLCNVKISFYAIDEAHCISEWGHDFRPEYRNIRKAIDRIGRAPIIALTATATDKVSLLPVAQESGAVGSAHSRKRHQSGGLSRRSGVGCALADSGRFPHGTSRYHGCYDSIRHGNR